jgi:hypothetical protein
MRTVASMPSPQRARGIVIVRLTAVPAKTVVGPS